MNDADSEFLQQLRATFRVEAEEHLQAIAAGLVQLERMPRNAQQPVVESVFRAAHSLKGAARAVEFPEIEAVCQSLEETFAAWKRQDAAPSPQALDMLHGRLNRISALLAGGGEGSREPPAWVGRGPLAWAAAAPGPRADAAHSPAPVPAPEARSATPAATVRINAEVLDARLLEAEEMLAVKLAAGQRVLDLREVETRMRGWRGQPGERGQEQLKALGTRLAGLARAAEQDRDAVGKLVDDLLANSKRLLLLPFSTLSAAAPKLVRDLCRQQGKEADLTIEGEQIELDKRILDAIRDPLIHLLRNCVDHGIETPAQRARSGKPPRASVKLSVAQAAAGKVQITLSDDGAGIDTARVRAAAVKQGMVTAAEAASMGEPQAQALIFRSGVSTSPLITDLSGRGLGLAIVQEKAAALGGEVSVESRPGAGTQFRIVLPAMRATFRGILVEAAGRLLVLPTTEVERVLRVPDTDIRAVEGRNTVSLAERVIPVVPLAQVLELPQLRAAAANTGTALAVVGRGDQRVAFAVDQVLDEQEVLVKPLASPLERVRNVASATVLPSGQIAFILHVGDLLASARRSAAPAAREAAAEPGKAILVAEDSITSRMLIKGILESSGYRVTTAPDGLDAFARLRAGKFDLVVSDVEMPRLNGFDLTARIRAERALAQTPVVLVTALETREHRERGVDVGANAYIVKSNFDQSTLVDAVRRLIGAAGP